ncbi:MAG: site-2 protease family protein [Thermodesulfobacteriota bacterium]
MNLTKTHIILFVLTVITTFISGYLIDGSVLSGIYFSFSLLLILGAHEMGHYYYARKHRVSVTPPYFIPAPPFISPIGTFGAVIKIKSRMNTKKELFDIGVAGPILGILFAFPILFIGLYFSRTINIDSDTIKGGIELGNSLIFLFFSKLIFGNIPKESQIFLHPVAFAGWIGLLVTALNLIPSGQLDGGHIVYSVFPKKWHTNISKIVIAILIIFGFGTEPIFFLLKNYNIFDVDGSILSFLKFEGWLGWLLWGLILTFLGTKHPPTFFDEVDIGLKRKIIAVIALLIFIICFAPVPIKIIQSG